MNSRTLALIIKAYDKSKPAFRAVANGMKSVKKTSAKVASAIRKGWKAVGKAITVATGFIKTAIKLAIIPLTILTAGFGLAIREAGAFEQAMANVASVTGSTGKEMDMLSDAAREMGRTTVFTAQDAADALYNLASAGFNADQAVDALEGTMLLAAATASELAFTTASVAAAIKQFGLEASDADRVANVFAASISFSMLTMTKLTDAMVYAGPVAGALGQSLEGTVAALMNFANQGLRGSQIGTTFRMGLMQLGKAIPAKELESGADVLKRLNIAFKEIDPSTKSVADIVEALHGKVTTLTEAMALFGTRGAGPWLKMIKAGAEPLRKEEEQIKNTQKAREMARIQLNTFYGSLKKLKSAASAALEGFGKTFLPVLTKITAKVTEWVNVLGKTDWGKVWKEFQGHASKGAETLQNLIDLFKDGGAFRVAITEWGVWFLDIITSIATVIWRPVETEFNLMFMRVMAKMHEELGKTKTGRAMGFDQKHIRAEQFKEAGWQMFGWDVSKQTAAAGSLLGIPSTRTEAQTIPYGKYSQAARADYKAAQQDKLSSDISALVSIMSTKGASSAVARTDEAMIELSKVLSGQETLLSKAEAFLLKSITRDDPSFRDLRTVLTGAREPATLQEALVLESFGERGTATKTATSSNQTMKTIEAYIEKNEEALEAIHEGNVNARKHLEKKIAFLTSRLDSWKMKMTSGMHASIGALE